MVTVVLTEQRPLSVLLIESMMAAPRGNHLTGRANGEPQGHTQRRPSPLAALLGPVIRFVCEASRAEWAALYPDNLRPSLKR